LTLMLEEVELIHTPGESLLVTHMERLLLRFAAVEDAFHPEAAGVQEETFMDVAEVDINLKLEYLTPKHLFNPMLFITFTIKPI
jgi:hypothetical protein